MAKNAGSDGEVRAAGHGRTLAFRHVAITWALLIGTAGVVVLGLLMIQVEDLRTSQDRMANQQVHIGTALDHINANTAALPTTKDAGAIAEQLAEIKFCVADLARQQTPLYNDRLCP